MGALFEVKEIDRKIYEEELKNFLPDTMIDIHTHVWLDRFKAHVKDEYARVVKWPSLVARENPIEDLIETYGLMFPGKRVTPLSFSSIKQGDDMDGANAYMSESAKKHGTYALLYSSPWWSAEEMERRVIEGEFLGIKVYLNFAPKYLPRQEIRIFDFLPHHFLKVLNARGWIAMLHIPRDDRLKDPVNLAQMLEIESSYPNVRLIIAHVGRAYCNEDVGNAFEVLRESKRMVFDFSANTNAWVFEQLIKAVGPKRILFGSDLPIVRMRMRRVCRDGVYVNIVPKALYGDVSDDKNMDELEGEEAEKLTFFMYEEILAIKRACRRLGLGRADVEALFDGNARRLLGI